MCWCSWSNKSDKVDQNRVKKRQTHQLKLRTEAATVRQNSGSQTRYNRTRGEWECKVEIEIGNGLVMILPTVICSGILSVNAKEISVGKMKSEGQTLHSLSFWDIKFWHKGVWVPFELHSAVYWFLCTSAVGHLNLWTLLFMILVLTFNYIVGK